jgi:hypothetical protein
MNYKFSNVVQYMRKFSALLLSSEKATTGGNCLLTECMLWTNVEISSVLSLVHHEFQWASQKSDKI